MALDHSSVGLGDVGLPPEVVPRSLADVESLEDAEDANIPLAVHEEVRLGGTYVTEVAFRYDCDAGEVAEAVTEQRRNIGECRRDQALTLAVAWVLQNDFSIEMVLLATGRPNFVWLEQEHWVLAIGWRWLCNSFACRLQRRPVLKTYLQHEKPIAPGICHCWS